jgi:hypothetical protein
MYRTRRHKTNNFDFQLKILLIKVIQMKKPLRYYNQNGF